MKNKEPIYSKGDHIIAKNGTHGIIYKLTNSNRGWVYCIVKDDFIGLACIEEKNVKGLYIKKK